MSDRRMIEDYLPVQQISYESAREKVARRRQGHLSTIHLWWARRPLAACRAAIYAAFAPPAEGEERDLHFPKLKTLAGGERAHTSPRGGHQT